jgi:predicted unusual protein kinase regulating ubiquinone biosynthesis (AarF/ABC1/UbiB family)
VNRDLAVRNSRRVKLPEVSHSETTNRVIELTRLTGEDRYKAQGGERSSSSGRTIAKSGEVVAGPGL